MQHRSGLVHLSSKTTGGLTSRLPVRQHGLHAFGRSAPRSLISKKLSSQRLREARANQQPHHNESQAEGPHPPPSSEKDDMRALQEQMLAMQKILLEQQSRNAAMQQQMELLVSRLAAPENASSSNSDSSSQGMNAPPAAGASRDPSLQDPELQGKPSSAPAHEPSPPSPATPPPPEPTGAQTADILFHGSEVQRVPTIEAGIPDGHSIHAPTEPLVHAQVHTQEHTQVHAPATHAAAPTEPLAVSGEASPGAGGAAPAAESDDPTVSAAAKGEAAATPAVDAHRASASAPEQQDLPEARAPQHAAPTSTPPGPAFEQGQAGTSAATAAAPAEAPAAQPTPATAPAAAAAPAAAGGTAAQPRAPSARAAPPAAPPPVKAVHAPSPRAVSPSPPSRAPGVNQGSFGKISKSPSMDYSSGFEEDADESPYESDFEDVEDQDTINQKCKLLSNIEDLERTHQSNAYGDTRAISQVCERVGLSTKTGKAAALRERCQQSLGRMFPEVYAYLRKMRTQESLDESQIQRALQELVGRDSEMLKGCFLVDQLVFQETCHQLF
mmetsp:Transcript_1711/g.3847  ORF Transcript_1711/g.3847 Transcript_1711/m.3847 type:complete len:555 (+) Transcript_1711:108-1772(+)